MSYGKEYLNITIKPETKERLLKIGKMSDSMDTLINRLLDIYEQHEEDAQ